MVIKETQNDDLTSVMQELIETYGDQMADVAVSLCQELVSGRGNMGGGKGLLLGCSPSNRNRSSMERSLDVNYQISQVG